MRTALLSTGPSPEDLSQLPTKPCYLIRVEPDQGLQWVASALRKWQLPDGRPDFRVIAPAAGVGFQHLFKLRKDPAQAPGNRTMAGLVRIAARAHGVSLKVAHERIFWFFDPDSPRDVERLLSYLQPAEELEAAAA